MENQTHAQNQRVPVIQVSGLKKQYKLGQIGGGTRTNVYGRRCKNIRMYGLWKNKDRKSRSLRT